MTDLLLTVGIGYLAVVQTLWCVVYGTGAWRTTPLGWVWLLKGGGFALLWVALFVNRLADLPDWLWVLLSVVLATATTLWLVVTVKARFGKYAPYL